MLLRKKQNTVLAGMLMAISLNSFAENPVTLVPYEQEAVVLEYPDISMNQINYRGIEVEYTLSGDASIRGLQKITTTVNCPAGPESIAQLQVNYEAPKILVRVKDLTRGENRYNGALPSEDKKILGAATCGAKNDLAALEAEFNAGKDAFLKGLKTREQNAMREKVESFVRDNATVTRKPIEIVSFQFKSNTSDFTNLNQAYDIATKAYAMIHEKGALWEASEGIKGAIELWEMAMGNPTINSRSDAKKIKAAVAYNLSNAYLIAMNYMQSSAYHKLAHMLNSESGGTLKLPDNQARINRQLRNRSASNTVPNNVVALVTLERDGSEYLKRPQFTELDPVAFKEREHAVDASPVTTASLE